MKELIAIRYRTKAGWDKANADRDKTTADWYKAYIEIKELEKSKGD